MLLVTWKAKENLKSWIAAEIRGGSMRYSGPTNQQYRLYRLIRFLRCVNVTELSKLTDSELKLPFNQKSTFKEFVMNESQFVDRIPESKEERRPENWRARQRKTWKEYIFVLFRELWVFRISLTKKFQMERMKNLGEEPSCLAIGNCIGRFRPSEHPGVSQWSSAQFNVNRANIASQTFMLSIDSLKNSGY